MLDPQGDRVILRSDLRPRPCGFRSSDFRSNGRFAVALTATWIAVSALRAADSSTADVSFQRDVRPILSRYCFKCHGPDERTRESGLRLDKRAVATAPAASGSVAVTPGEPQQSELVRRIFNEDADERMPPAATKTALSEEQKATLRRWIEAGAPYEKHWAFVPPERPSLPDAPPGFEPRNPIDLLVAARRHAAGLVAAPEADRQVLVRRVYLDLIGLPPTPAEADAFVHDPAPSAYEDFVDRLLASPRYGERWARRWLDLARYADTNGYEKDRRRTIWPYRDRVIDSLNADVPFDEFTVEQLAGDMLPNATVPQIVATGFHRNTMINEEGGIDPLEFRFHAMTDRVATTGTTWLGLTIGCAQCHTHKFDPITHREYYQFMALLNNADEPDFDLPDRDVAAQRDERQAKIAALLDALPEKYPVEEEVAWRTPTPRVTTESGQEPELLDDASALFVAETPEQDTYRFVLPAAGESFDRLRIEALADDRLPSNGPGRTPHGNFILSEVTLTAVTSGGDARRPLALASASADAAQKGYPAGSIVDGDRATGWAVHVDVPEWNVSRTATIRLAERVELQSDEHLLVSLEQAGGGHHTLGRVRLSLGEPKEDLADGEALRQRALQHAFAEWKTEERKHATRWEVLRPHAATSNLPLLTVEDDDAVYVSGDTSKLDTYQLAYRPSARRISALRLEALPDARLPKHGPGMTFYEGPKGDFFLGEIRVRADGAPVTFAKASESYGKLGIGGGRSAAELAFDGHLQTGWSTSGREGEAHEAVFVLREPLPAVDLLEVEMVFGRHYAASLGRFRISVSDDPEAALARVGEEARRLLLKPDAALGQAERDLLFREFLLRTPKLRDARTDLERLRKLPAFPTTMVMRERPRENPRPTFIHARGEFLRPGETVGPGVPALFGKAGENPPTDRLSFARWLVSRDQPLTARVVVNREWGAFFGTGLVPTLDDFGYQGQAPVAPKLLDWLAVEFMESGWSLKRLHRLVVTSATYRQRSHVTETMLDRDPKNRLLARGPRGRLEAELIRDLALHACGLLSAKMHGPSVFPPQPPGVTTEGTYGRLDWKPSPGEDRYRRGTLHL